MNRYVVTKDNLAQLNAQKGFAPGQLEDDLAECEARGCQLLVVSDGIENWWSFWLAPSANLTVKQAFRLIKEELKL